ncbi:MAG: energy-coupling factor transporter transmembrane component T [Acidobacteriota bacterium]
MHHAVVDRWSHGHSLLHARDARVKLLVLLVFLVALATARVSALTILAYSFLLAAAIAVARLPVGGVLLRACVVLPFTAVFACLSLLAGEGSRALALAVRSYLSAAAVLVLAGTTPLPEFLRGLESLGAPRFLVLVVQFLYRYLFVISEQAQHMRLAACSRGAARGPLGPDRARFRAASGAVAVLFARSYARAQAIHRAMLARGFEGRIRMLSAPRLTAADWLFLALGILISLAPLAGTP